jgi:epoxyqueuosine reductase QueG
MVGIIPLDDVKEVRLKETTLHLLPETGSIVVLAREIYPEILGHFSPERVMGRASLSDLFIHHTDFVNGRLTESAYRVAKACRRQGLKALPLPARGCPADVRFLEAVFSYKHAAQAAGLGYIGRSSLLITPDFGPRVRLSCCLTQATLEPKTATVSDVCEGCDICIEGCPAGALKSPPAGEAYVINKFACTTFRNGSGGCAECMRLCPAG